jgi:hypothetical protein
MESLMLVAETDAPQMLARIAGMKALNRHQPTERGASGAAKPGQGLSDRPVIEAARI